MKWRGRVVVGILVVLAVVAWNLAGPPPPATHEDRSPTLAGETPYGVPAR